MRALADWYFTAHPPIMHDLHEAMPLLYTYSGGPPQNPNLDPLLFTELPFFANFELAQMTKWGMPGVYTHAFMDGWSPGYLGSVAYNHNGMMRMSETQSGTEGPTAPVTTQGAPTEGARGARGAGSARGAGVRGAGGAKGCEGCRGCPGVRGGAEGARRTVGGGRVRRVRDRGAGGAVARRPPRTPERAEGRQVDADRRQARQPDAVDRSPANGTAGYRCRRTPPRPSRGGTTRITCRPPC